MTDVMLFHSESTELCKNNWVMRSRIFQIGFSVVVAMVVLTAYVTGPPAEVTNAPGESTCYDNPLCHAAVPDTGPGFGEITIMGGIPSCGYVPGQSYILMPYVIDTTQVIYGFQTVAVDATNSGVGTVTITDPSKTQLITSSGKEYVEHTLTGTNVLGIHDWMYQWTAPAAGSGDVTFYSAFNAANGDGTSAGDNIYTDSLVFQECTTIGTTDFGIETGFLYPNPVTDHVNVYLGNTLSGEIGIRVFDLQGKVVFDQIFQTANLESIRISAENWENQTYLLKVISNEVNISVQKLIVLR